MEDVGGAGGRVEYEGWGGAVRGVGGCLGEGEEFLVAPGGGFMAALCEGEKRRLLFLVRAYAEEGFGC